MSGFLIGMNHYIKSNKGTSLVEFALILPLLLLLFGGIIDFGYMMHQYLVIDEVARAAARYASINKDNQTAEQLALQGTTDISNWQPKIKFDFVPPRNATGQTSLHSQVTVTVTCERLKLSGLLDYIGLPDHITRSVVAMTE